MFTCNECKISSLSFKMFNNFKDFCYSYLILNNILQCLMVAHESLLIIKLVNLRTEDDLNVLKIYALYIHCIPILILMFEKLNNLIYKGRILYQITNSTMPQNSTNIILHLLQNPKIVYSHWQHMILHITWKLIAYQTVLTNMLAGKEGG